MPDRAVVRRHLCATRLGTVHYVEAGPTTGTPYVLLHQTPRSVDEFAEVIPRLAATRRVIAIDTPGYGCSDHPRLQPTLADYAGAMLDVLDAADVATATVVGHHTGAVIAVELAASAPDRVPEVALSGPVYLDAETRRQLAAHFAQWHVQADGSHLLDKWRKFVSWTADPTLTQRLVVDLFKAGETSEYGHFAVADYHMEERLPRAAARALLVYGARDPFADPAQRTMFERALQVVAAVTLDAGVFLPNEAPEALADALLHHLP